jgi:hypothetical protein
VMFAHGDVAHIDDFVPERSIFWRINSHLAPRPVCLILVLDVWVGPGCATAIAVKMLAAAPSVALLACENDARGCGRAAAGRLTTRRSQGS